MVFERLLSTQIVCFPMCAWKIFSSFMRTDRCHLEAVLHLTPGYVRDIIFFSGLGTLPCYSGCKPPEPSHAKPQHCAQGKDAVLSLSPRWIHNLATKSFSLCHLRQAYSNSTASFPFHRSKPLRFEDLSRGRQLSQVGLGLEHPPTDSNSGNSPI